MGTGEIPDGIFPTRQQSNTEPHMQQLLRTVLVMIGSCKPRAPETRWIRYLVNAVSPVTSLGFADSPSPSSPCQPGVGEGSG